MDKLLVCLPENGAIPLFRNQRIDQRNMRKESTCFEEFFAAFRLAVIRIFYFYPTRSPIISNVPSTLPLRDDAFQVEFADLPEQTRIRFSRDGRGSAAETVGAAWRMSLVIEALT